jgi:hypothetical protein
VREHSVLLENLFFIRIGSRDPGKHFLVLQCLVGAGNVLFAFSRIHAIAAATNFSVATVCFFSFGSPLLTVFKSFLPFDNFFT